VAAEQGDPAAFALPRPLLGQGGVQGEQHRFNFSFSGLKTAVLNTVRGLEQAASALAEATPEVELREGLTRWVPGDGVVALQRELEARLTRAAVGEFRTGDPLGAGIPLAFTVAKTSEARNLRLLADGAARDVDPDELRSKLVLAEQEPR
jgi:hypothetical protein